jgi:hypothetical protein
MFFMPRATPQSLDRQGSVCYSESLKAVNEKAQAVMEKEKDS